MRGKSDIIGMNPQGRFIAIEVKVGKDKLRDEQELFLENVVDHGGISVVVKTFDEFMIYFNENYFNG